MDTIEIKEMETLYVPAQDGARRLEDYWKLESDDLEFLSKAGTFTAKPTPEGRLIMLQIRSSNNVLPRQRKDVVAAIMKHLGITNKRLLDLTEDQAIYVMENHHGMLPRSVDTEIFIRRDTAHPFVGTLTWQLSSRTQKRDKLELWLTENTTGWALDVEGPSIWVIVPKTS